MIHFFCQKNKNVLFFNSYAQKTAFFYISDKNLVCSPIIIREQASKENYLPHEISTLLAVFLLIDLLDYTAEPEGSQKFPITLLFFS